MRSFALLLSLLLVGCLSVVQRHPGATGVLSSGGRPVPGAAIWQTGSVGPGACQASEPKPDDFVARSDARGRFEAFGKQGWRASGALPLPKEFTRRWTLCVRPEAGPVFASTLHSYSPGVPSAARYACELGYAGLTCNWERTRRPAPTRW
jgi:hypothetical protein